MLLNLKPMAHHAGILLLLKSLGRGQFFGPMLPVTFYWPQSWPGLARHHKNSASELAREQI